jgi:spore coat protein CotF
MNQNTMPHGNTGFQPNITMLQQNAHWTDEEIVSDLLTTEKSLVGFYAATACETTCPNLRQVLIQNLGSAVNDQYQVFDQMRQRNWYPVKNAPPQEVQEAKQKLSQIKGQICKQQ